MTTEQQTATKNAGNATKTGTQTAPATPPKRERKRQKVESMMARPWKPEAKGDCLEGIYQGMEIVPGKGKRKAFPSYHIERPDGERVRVASAMLNTKLNQVPKGAYVWLTYLGMFTTQNGDSPDYEVETEEGTELIDPLQGNGDVREDRID